MIGTFLLKRYLVPKEGNLLSFVLWISVAGVALGIAVLILVLGVMSGFQDFLQTRYTRITSEIVLLPRHHHEKKLDLVEEILKTRGVKAASPFLMAQGMLFAKGVAGAVIEGIDLGTIDKVIPLKDVFSSAPDPETQMKTEQWIWLGKGLADKLKVGVGDEVSVLVNDGKDGNIPFKVTGITKFGIYDHDLRYAYMALPVLAKHFKRENDATMVKVKLEDPSRINQVTSELKEKFATFANVKRWTDLNQNIFLAVAHQKKMLFIVLEIIVALAGVNVINLLMMSSHYRKRDTAILRAMGMRFRTVVLFFVGQGAAVGAVGVIVGVGLGLGLAEGIRHWKLNLLSESVYNVTSLPMRVDFADVALICGVAFVLCVVFSVIPALRAARARPVQSLRME